MRRYPSRPACGSAVWTNTTIARGRKMRLDRRVAGGFLDNAMPALLADKPWLMWLVLAAIGVLLIFGILRRRGVPPGSVLRGTADGLIDGISRIGSLIGGTLSVAFAGALACGVWWVWFNAMPGPEWGLFQWIWMAFLALFACAAVGLFYQGLGHLRQAFRSSPRLDNQRVHGKADLADEEEAARAVRKARESDSKRGLNLNY
jgi:hypothetical protein